MKRHASILLMLAIAALQGGGVIHAVHLAIEHSCECGDHSGRRDATHESRSHCAGESATPAMESCGGGHSHDPAACAICRTLANLNATADETRPSLSACPPPAIAVAPHDVVRQGRRLLTNLAPRAPPAEARKSLSLV